MARAKSVVITPAEKKNLIAAVKVQIKDTTLQFKAMQKTEKDVARERAANDKQFAKDKAAVEKSLTGFNAQLAALAA